MATRLREWRRAHGLTVDEVAALTGYCEATISRLERGERQLRPLDKVRFARSLRIPLRELFEFAEPNMHDPEEVSTS